MEITAFLLSLHVFLRLFLGGIVLCSGITKAVHPRRAARAVREYKLLPPALEAHAAVVHAISGTLWVAEILAGVGMITGVLLIPASVLALCLFGIFSGAIGINLARGRTDLSCHCGGVLGDHRISWWLISRNSLLLLGTVLLLNLPADPFALDHWPLPGVTAWVNIVLPMILIAGVFLLVFALARAVHPLLRA